MEIPTLINSSSKINGELMFKSDVRIDGEVFGKVESDKNAIIGAEGYVKGFLRARDLVVFGRLEGNIIVSGTTILHSGSSIFGNLYTKIIEVNDGAVITARVITYDKLGAFDEAQIHMAEERIKIQPIRKNIPIYSNVEITFDDKPEMENLDCESDSVFGGEPFMMAKSDDSGDILSKIIAESNESDEAEEIFELFESSKIAVDSELLKSDVLAETMENTLIDELDDDNSENLTTSSSSSVQSDNPQLELSELLDSAPVSEAKSPDAQNKEVETNLTEHHANPFEVVEHSTPVSVDFESFLGEPVKEESHLNRIGNPKIYKPDTISPAKAVRKGKGHIILGFEELRNLLSPTKYAEDKLIEKKNGQAKYEPHKVIDIENEVIDSEKSKFSLNDAISQLPFDDYSSLFK